MEIREKKEYKKKTCDNCGGTGKGFESYPSFEGSVCGGTGELIENV